MFFESFLLNVTIIVVLIFALIFDYVTKFFSYWYVRHVPYKQPSIPFFGSDYHRVLGLRSTTEDVNILYSKHPNDKFVGRIISRIPDLIIKDPDVIKRMLSTDFANFHSRGLSLNKSRDVCLRDNLYHADGEKWTLLRQGYESLLSNIDTRLESSSDYLQGTNGETDVQHALSMVLDKIFTELLFGNNEDGSVIRNVRSVIQRRTAIERIKSYLKNIFPSLYVFFGLTTLFGEPSLRTKEALDISKLMNQIKNLGNLYQLGINEKSVSKHSCNDFAFSVLCSFISDGYIPCLNILTAILFELAWNPDVQEKCRISVSKDRREDYLDVTIKEALRLYPPYSTISRKCMKIYHCQEGNMVIDRKVTINIPVEAIHKDEEHYKNSKMFNPDRFLTEGSSTHSYAYLPFGAGPRKCIGETLALKIIKDVTKTILEDFEIQPCRRTPTTLKMVDHNFGRVVDKNLWLLFKPRNEKMNLNTSS